MIALDTNLLVYAHHPDSPEHGATRRAIETLVAEEEGCWGVALPTIAEFWTVVTHPKLKAQRSSVEQARRFLTALIDAGARIYEPGDRFGERLTGAAVDLGVQGPRIFDLQIALTAFDNGVTRIWTHDERFVAMPGQRVYNPLSPAG